ncbi:MFS transporter [Actinokineospora soli]|uniref:MFS transporter n=1 Tax=Actinokineospora soli TaxID=1048753 RepID=A0ABW2TMK5_9PSEU
MFATAGVIAFLTAADTTVVAAAALSAAADLGVGLAATQAVTAAYLVPFAGLLLTAGAVVDRVGERAALRAGLAAFAVGTVLAGLGSHLVVLLAGRAVQGAAAALLVPAAMGAIRTRLDPADRPRGAAVWTVSLAAALAGGPALGGLAAEHLHWSAVFWGFLPLLALGMAVLPPPVSTVPPPTAPLDLPGGGLLAAAMALLTGGLLVLADGGALAGPLCVAGLAVAGLTGLRRGSVLPRGCSPTGSCAARSRRRRCGASG